MVVFQTRTYILLLIIIGLLLYTTSLLNGFVGDDWDQIVNNPQVHSLKNIPKFFTGSTYFNQQTERLTGLYYRPIMMSTFALLYAFFKTDPLFFHLLQLILFIGNAVLVFFLFSRFFKTAFAFFAALIFLIHPINAETALYIANMQEVLCMFFGLSALLILTQKTTAFHKKQYFLFAILVLLSLFSKESGVFFIGISIIYAYLFKKKLLKNIVLLVLSVSVTYGIFRFGIAQMFHTQFAIAPIAKAALPLRLINIPAIIFYYLKTFFFPLDLITTQFWMIKQVTITTFFLPLLAILAFGTLIIRLRKKIPKKADNPRLFFFFSFWSLIGLLLHIQILPLDMTVADRWFYIPSLGLLGILTYFISCLSFKNKTQQKTFLFTCILLSLLLCARTFIRTHDWKDTLKLYQHDLHTDPTNFFLQNGVGSEYIRDKKYKEAKPYIVESVKIYPYIANLNNLAIIYLSEKNIPKTKEYLEKSIQAGDSAMVYQNFSNFLLNYQRPKDAVTFTLTALQKYPKNWVLWSNLAYGEYFLGNTKQALSAAEKAYELNQSLSNYALVNKIKKGQPLYLKIIKPQ